jgi:hypothetical protein
MMQLIQTPRGWINQMVHVFLILGGRDHCILTVCGKAHETRLIRADVLRLTSTHIVKIPELYALVVAEDSEDTVLGFLMTYVNGTWLLSKCIEERSLTVEHETMLDED